LLSELNVLKYPASPAFRSVTPSITPAGSYPARPVNTASTKRASSELENPMQTSPVRVTATLGKK
jgi:hypothetical protein